MTETRRCKRIRLTITRRRPNYHKCMHPRSGLSVPTFLLPLFRFVSFLLFSLLFLFFFFFFLSSSPIFEREIFFPAGTATIFTSFIWRANSNAYKRFSSLAGNIRRDTTATISKFFSIFNLLLFFSLYLSFFFFFLLLFFLFFFLSSPPIVLDVKRFIKHRRNSRERRKQI